MKSLWSVMVYTVAVVGFIWWVWTKTRALNSAHTAQQGGKGHSGGRKGDDLTEISGIGKVIAGKLKKLGYKRFEQIAAFTKQDIDRVNEQLNFKGRIEREQWVRQAKTLVRKKQ